MHVARASLPVLFEARSRPSTPDTSGITFSQPLVLLNIPASLVPSMIRRGTGILARALSRLDPRFRILNAGPPMALHFRNPLAFSNIPASLVPSMIRRGTGILPVLLEA
jgi:hypothetical protein